MALLPCLLASLSLSLSICKMGSRAVSAVQEEDEPRHGKPQVSPQQVRSHSGVGWRFREGSLEEEAPHAREQADEARLTIQEGAGKRVPGCCDADDLISG